MSTGVVLGIIAALFFLTHGSRLGVVLALTIALGIYIT